MIENIIESLSHHLDKSKMNSNKKDVFKNALDSLNFGIQNLKEMLVNKKVKLDLNVSIYQELALIQKIWEKIFIDQFDTKIIKKICIKIHHKIEDIFNNLKNENNWNIDEEEIHLEVNNFFDNIENVSIDDSQLENEENVSPNEDNNSNIINNNLELGNAINENNENNDKEVIRLKMKVNGLLENHNFNSNLEKEIEYFKKFTQTLNLKNEELVEENIKLKVNIQISSKEKEDLKLLSNLKNKKISMDSKINTLENLLKESSEKIINFIESQKNYQKEIESLNNDLNWIKNEFNLAISKNEELFEIIAKKTQENIELKSIINTEKNNKEEFKNNIFSLQSINENKIENLLNNINTLNQKINLMERDNSKEIEINHLKVELNEKEKLINLERSNFINEKNKLVNDLDILNNEKSKYVVNNQLKKDMDNLRKENLKSIEDYRNLEFNNSKLLKDLNMLENKNNLLQEDINYGKKEKKNLEEDFKKLKSDYLNIEKDNYELKKEKYQNNLNKNLIGDIEKDKNNLKIELLNNRSELEELKIYKEKYNQLIKERNLDLEAKRKYEEILNENKEKMYKVNKEWIIIKKEKDYIKEKNNILENKFEDLNNKNEALNLMKNDINELKITLNNRSLKNYNIYYDTTGDDYNYNKIQDKYNNKSDIMYNDNLINSSNLKIDRIHRKLENNSKYYSRNYQKEEEYKKEKERIINNYDDFKNCDLSKNPVRMYK